MKLKFFAGLMALLSASSLYASDRILPKACGSDGTQFEVKGQKTSAEIPPPSEGKAILVFVQTYTLKGSSFLAFGTSDFTTRFGIDGTWAGAAGNNSYFFVEVTPGIHHLCAAVQGSSDPVKEMVGADLLNFETGKTYYFEFLAQKVHGNCGGCNYYSSSFREINPDEGAYRVASTGLSTFKSKKQGGL